MSAWQIDHYENDVIIRQNGITTITEIIRVDFAGEQRHGIYRNIPIHAQDARGQHAKTRIRIWAVTDENGNAWPYRFVANDFYLMIRIGDPDRTLSGKQVYKITYDVESGAIRFFKDHEEFFWNLIGTGWEVPILESVSRIQIPPRVKGVRAVAYQGVYGSATRLKNIKGEGNLITMRSHGPLRAQEGVTAAIGWDKGGVQQPARAKRIRWWLEDNGIIAMPVLVFLFMFFLWCRKGRDPQTGESLTVQYEPPSGMTPGEMGTLIDQKAHMKDITASLIDLAVKGYLKIETLPQKMLQDADYQLTSLKPWEASNLKAHEQAILKGVFGGPRETVKLSDLNEKFYSKLNGIRLKIYSSLTKERLLDRNPEEMRAAYWVFGVMTGLISFFGLRFLINEYVLSTRMLFICSFISGMTILLFGFWMPRRTLKGAKLMDHVRGFSEFLKRADSDRIKRMNDPSLFERCLPYAMVLGFADQWARAFEGIYLQAPAWYIGTGSDHFSSSQFTRSMGKVSSSLGSAFGSVPSSSSSGFSSGGGFSGGGGGGGGGGAW